MTSVWGLYRNSPLPPTLKFQSRTSGIPRPTSIPSKSPWSGRARWWVGMGCWPRRSWRCWRPLHQSPPSPRWSSWWFPDTSTISPRVILKKKPQLPTHSRRELWVTEHTLFHVGLEVDGESKPDGPLFTAARRANGGRGGGSTWGGGKSAGSPFKCSPTLSCFRLINNAASLQIIRSYHVVRRVTCSNAASSTDCSGEFSSTREKHGAIRRRGRKNIRPLWPRRTQREPRRALLWSAE